MERELVWYGDLDLAPPTPRQYHENLLRQVDQRSPVGDGPDEISPDTPTWDLERMIDTQNYIPLITEDYKMAFCQVTSALPELCQVHIWKAPMRDDISIETPQTPKKPYVMSKRMKSHMTRWAARKKLTY